MTGALYIWNVMLRAKTEYTVLELDPGTVLMAINDARRWTANMVTELAPWKASANLTDVSPYTFMADKHFVRADVVAVGPDSDNILWPGRRVDKRELARVIDNTYDTPTNRSPVWYGAKQNITAYVADTPYTGDITILYVRGPADLTESDDEEALGIIPWEYQELVIKRALVICYEKLAMLGALQAVEQDVAVMLNTFSSQFTSANRNTRLALESRRNPIIGVVQQ